MNKHNHAECQELLANICEYMDNELDKANCEKLEKHISECEDCQIVIKTLRKTITLSKDVTKDIVLPKDTYNRLLAQLGLEQDESHD